jgi:membrane fusion protein, heavy metal efflux system
MRINKRSLMVFIALALFFLHVAGCQEKSEGRKEKAEEKKGTVKEIVLTAEQVETAGIVTEKLKYETLEERIAITGELEAVPDRSSKVTSRFSGKVNKLLVQEGDRVKQGAPLVVIESVELAQADAAFHQAQSELAMAEKNLARVRDMAKLGLFSRSTLEEARNACAQAQASRDGAKAELLLAQKQYDRIKELNLSGIAATKDLERADADLKKAGAGGQSAIVSLESARARLKREEENFRKGHLTYKEVLEAEKLQEQALSHYHSALATFQILGIDEHNHGRTFTLSSPIEGMVTALQITGGEAVVPTTPLMMIVNTDTLWLMADIYEKDLRKVRTGQKATFTVYAFPGKIFRGRLSYISPMMDEKTRSVKARVQVMNRECRLKVHMFARGNINVEHERKALLIPLESIQKEGDKSIVYVLKEKPGTFVPAEVKAGLSYGGRQEILKGLEAGQTIAVKGSFMVRSEEQKSSLEGEE